MIGGWATGVEEMALRGLDAGCTYWKHTQLILDVTPGRGSSFSLEIPLGVRFYIRSRMFTEEGIGGVAGGGGWVRPPEVLGWGVA